MPDYQVIASGSFTSDGSAHDVVLRSDFDVMEVINQTQSATTQGTGRGCKFEWVRGFADNAGLMWTKQNASNAIDLEFITSGGFLRVDSSVQTPEAAKATSGTDVTNANPAVVTVTAHGYSTGDRVRMIGTTAMLEIAGMDFHVTRVDANSFQLTYLDASGFSAAATAGFARRLPNDPIYAPNRLLITGISAATSAVVTLSDTHGLAVDDEIRLHCSSDFGMVEIDNLVGTVTAVAVNTVTVDIDSSGFTAFAFPTSATAAGGVTHPHLVPFGSVSTNVNQALDNQAQILMRLAAGADSPAGSTSDVIFWKASKSAEHTAE